MLFLAVRERVIAGDSGAGIEDFLAADADEGEAVCGDERAEEQGEDAEGELHFGWAF